MKRLLAVLAAAAILVPMAASATPNINGAVVIPRVWNDCPFSAFTADNSYPALIGFEDINASCTGYANLHVWRLSDDGGLTPAVFGNESNFRVCADLVISGPGEGEAGIQISPWWSQNVDGRFNVRTTDGEIACFGGRLPFYNFTGSLGVTYVKGTSIHLEMTYLANMLTESDPATVNYVVVYNSLTYQSGPLPFDQGNPAEDPPYGQWGMLNDGRVGGHMQYFLINSQPDLLLRVEWTNICYENLDAIPVESTTWGGIKALYR